jgi:hypothetical protein
MPAPQNFVQIIQAFGIDPHFDLLLRRLCGIKIQELADEDASQAA